MEEEVRYEKRRQKFSLFMVIIFVVLALAVYYAAQHQGVKQVVQLPAVSMPATPGTYPVTEFVDGDTIAVNMDGRNEKVRLIGVDTPETHKPKTPVQCYGPQAAAYTKSIIGSHRVKLVADPLDTDRDRYGRLLRYVYTDDGTFVNASLVQAGYGFAYTNFPFQKKQEFVSDQSVAKQIGKGLWSACTVTSDSSGQHTNSL